MSIDRVRRQNAPVQSYRFESPILINGLKTARAEKATKTTKAAEPAKETKEMAEKEIKGRSGNSTPRKHEAQRNCAQTVLTPSKFAFSSTKAGANAKHARLLTSARIA